MNIWILVSVFLSLVLVFPQDTMGKDLAEEEIIRTVFVYQMGHCYRERSPEMYFLSYKGNDPSNALIEKLQGPHKIYPRSQMSSFWNKLSGQRGILLAITRTRRLSDKAVEVRGSCIAGSMDAYSYDYFLKRRNHRWVVIRRTLKGIS